MFLMFAVFNNVFKSFERRIFTIFLTSKVDKKNSSTSDMISANVLKHYTPFTFSMFAAQPTSNRGYADYVNLSLEPTTGQCSPHICINSTEAMKNTFCNLFYVTSGFRGDEKCLFFSSGCYEHYACLIFYDAILNSIPIKNECVKT